MSETQLYLRHCNEQPARGITVNRDTVESVLALARAVQPIAAVVIHGDLETGLSIHIPAGRPWEVEPGGTVARTFTYTPLPAGQHRTSAGHS